MCWPLFQGQHAALHALVPLHRLLLSAGSTHLQPGPLRFMVPVSPEELSSADVDMEEEDVEEDMEEDVEEDMDPGEAIAQQIIQQAPAAPMALEGQSIGWGACLLSTLLPHSTEGLHFHCAKAQQPGLGVRVLCMPATQLALGG